MQDFSKLTTEKEELLGLTCEKYSEKKSNEEIVFHSFFKDQKLFILKPLYQRSLIVVAGPVANFVLALMIFVFIYMFVGKDFTPAVIDEVQKESPAEIAGLKKNDIIIVQADRKTLENALNTLGEQLHPQFSDTKDVVTSDSDEQILVEALISPDSRMAGRNLEEARFRKLTGCIALGIKRTSRIFREQITDIVLEAGDVLLVQGTKISIENLKSNQDVTLLDYTYTELHRKKFARRSIIIFLITIFTSRKMGGQAPLLNSCKQKYY